ncbi:MAG: VIT1/CCC1 transporter family protein [Chitinophagales bacterium]|nr:VIT1/CCC1 transporter family protein [Chitinophagales bacterium]
MHKQASPIHLHPEKHFTSSELVRDVVIGMSDGLTVPFALAAGLSGAVDSTAIILTAGLAEIAAGSIAMGLGGYLSAKSEADHYKNERMREEREIVELPHREEEEIYEILEEYGVSREEAKPVVLALQKHPEKWVDFMMRFELGLEEPDEKRSLYSALTIGGAYIAGGLVPLLPYWFTESAERGLFFSAIFTLMALLIFGFFKGKYTSGKPWRSSIETMLIGGVAAGAAYGIAKLLGG